MVFANEGNVWWCPLITDINTFSKSKERLSLTYQIYNVWIHVLQKQPQKAVLRSRCSLDPLKNSNMNDVQFY